MKRSIALSFLLLLFALLYSCVSLVNHYHFRTFALDLGLYTHAAYAFSNFSGYYEAMVSNPNQHLLADHFDLYLIAVSPFTRLLGSYTLLIFQIAALLFGGVGVYKYFEKDKTLALIASAYFYSFFGVFSALAFDYHSNVVSAALVPWFFYYVKEQRLKPALVFLVIIWVGKETIPFWMTFVCLGLAFHYFKDKKLRNYLFLFSGASLTFFLIITKWFMPLISATGNYDHFEYSVLGKNMTEAFIYLLSHPIESIQIMFTDHLQTVFDQDTKRTTFLLLTFAGLPILIRKPQFIIMLLPIVFQKMFHDRPPIWSWAGQYSIEFAPILAIGIFSVLRNIPLRTWSTGIGIFALVFSMGATIRTMDVPYHSIINPCEVRFYKACHYYREYDVQKVHRLLDALPDEASICAQSAFVPHLVQHKQLYQFPEEMETCEYIVLSPYESPYPYTYENYHKLVTEISMSPQWRLVSGDDHFSIYQRVAN